MYVHMTFAYAYMYVAHRALLAFRRHAYVDGQACATVVNHCHRVQGLSYLTATIYLRQCHDCRVVIFRVSPANFHHPKAPFISQDV